MEKCAPVIVFAYKRVDKLVECLTALENNKLVTQTDLYIFSDGAKGKADEINVKTVRDYIKKFCIHSSFQKVQVIESEKNKGLANSIISGVTYVIEKYGRAIIVEDDIVVSKDFLVYMNEALDYYDAYSEYGCISGYTLPIKSLKRYGKDVYVLRKGECWGWATWKDRWEKVDWQVKSYKEYCSNTKMRKEFDKLQAGLDDMLTMQLDGKIDSWAVRWCYHLFRNHLLTVYPTKSRVKNIGIDGSGTHCSAVDIFVSELEDEHKACLFERLDVNRELEKKTAQFGTTPRLWRVLYFVYLKLIGRSKSDA